MRCIQISVAASIAIDALLLIGCAFGRSHTSDAALERNFTLHETDFETLLVDIRADDKLGMVGINQARYAGHMLSDSKDLAEMESLGLSKEKWAMYQQLLRKLGVTQVIREQTSVLFKVDRESLLNGDSYKGYQYEETPPDHHKANLDKYRISEEDKDEYGNYLAFRPLKGKWYLSLFVNH